MPELRRGQGAWHVSADTRFRKGKLHQVLRRLSRDQGSRMLYRNVPSDPADSNRFLRERDFRSLTLMKHRFLHHAGLTWTWLGTKCASESQLKIGWTEQKCIEMDKLAQEDHSYRLSRDEIREISRTVISHIEQIGRECTDATSIRLPSSSHNQNRLHRESDEERAEPTPFQQYQRWHPSSSSDSW